jgi:hypothetical protein
MNKFITSYSITSASNLSFHKEPYFKGNSKQWVCPKHFPSVLHSHNAEGCSYVGCPSVRPDEEVATSTEEEILTIWYNDETRALVRCAKGTGANLVKSLQASESTCK